MDKIIKSDDLDLRLPTSEWNELDIDETINQLINLRDKYKDEYLKICWEYHKRYYTDGDIDELLLVGERMETDEEYEERKNLSDKMDKKNKEFRRKQYLNLKKEFDE